MPEHYRRDVTETLHWCKKCGRLTRHRVSCCRLQHCLEHEAQRYSKAQLERQRKEKEEKENPRLF